MYIVFVYSRSEEEKEKQKTLRHRCVCVCVEVKLSAFEASDSNMFTRRMDFNYIFSLHVELSVCVCTYVRAAGDSNPSRLYLPLIPAASSGINSRRWLCLRLCGGS